MSATPRRRQQAESRRAERRLAAERAARRRRLGVLGGVVAAALVLAVVLILANRPHNRSGGELELAAPLDPRIPVTGRMMGSPNAPVQVVEYGDYQCPGCGNFARTVQPQFINDYVANGKVRFEFHDFPFLDQRPGAAGEESHRAAEAAACALDQGKFWQYHDTLYQNQLGENVGSFTPARLKAIAGRLKLNEGSFDPCVDNRAHKQDVEQMATQAAQVGVDQTPSLTVNGKLIAFSSYDELKAAIAAALAQKT